MTRRHPADISQVEIESRICSRPWCNVPWAQLSALDFPAPSYVVHGEGYWTPATLQPWIEARARAHLLSMGGEVDTLARIAALSSGRSLSDHDARELASAQYARVVVRSVLKPS